MSFSEKVWEFSALLWAVSKDEEVVVSWEMFLGSFLKNNEFLLHSV